MATFERFVRTEAESLALAEKHGIALRSCTISDIETSTYLTDEQLLETLRLLDAMPDDQGEL